MCILIVLKAGEEALDPLPSLAVYTTLMVLRASEPIDF